MKSVLFAICLMSFVVYRAAKFEVSLLGTWKGSYKTIEKRVDVKIIFEQGNRIELHSNAINNDGKTIGFYTINKSNEILITCKMPEEDHISFTMNGKLNPNRNFLDGDWESNDHSSGSFYLQKTVSK